MVPKLQSHTSLDPFRVLAVLGIVVGLLMVIGAAVFWGLTGRESSLIVGAGMMLAIGGGLRNMLTSLADRLPIQPPPVEPPAPPLPPTPPPASQEGSGL